MNETERAAGLAPTPGYRYANRVGAELFIAGQVPLDAAGQLVGPDDHRAQAEQCLRNLSLLLGIHGYGRTAIRQVRIHVVGDQRDLAATWDAVVNWFGEVPPATLLGVTALGYAGQLVEVEATVVGETP